MGACNLTWECQGRFPEGGTAWPGLRRLCSIGQMSMLADEQGEHCGHS